MLNLKKTAVAVLAFGSSAVFAGTMGPVCTPGNVTVPCANTAWDFGVQALYLKPALSGYPYNGSVVNTAGTVETYNKNPLNWGWGFKLEGSYHFNTGNDLNLNWYHLDHTSKKTVPSVDLAALIAPGVIGTISVANDALNLKERWDAVNLEFGQLAHFGEWQNMRFHGGVQYAYINSHLIAGSTLLTADGEPVNEPSSINFNSKYSGFGPRIGADYSYNWGNGLGIYANGATALLVGTQSFNHFTSTVGFPSLTQVGSTTAIVPEVEAKLGATYTYAMAQGNLSLDVGWMWINYFQALAPATVLGLGETKETNFAVQGPFLGLKWVGNLA